ncbi:MAG TPA: 3-hydroxybutyrate dehydrogenase [Nocardioidaceae bacterium]|nr:3-hydroxybutyrate dehydrogenase [Nocardioidaceae bacterium]
MAPPLSLDALDLSGRRALVTGAASGIGRACAVRLAAAGAHVLALDVDADGAGEVAEKIGGEAVAADLSEPSFLDALDPRIDVVVNNAGFQQVAPLEQFPREGFTALLQVMLEAPFWIIAHVLPHMYQQRWGRIVNISSVHGLVASPHKAAYVTAKHGLQGLSKVTALEGAEHGVTSNCINPGYVRTPLVENQIADHARIRGWTPEEVVERVILERSALKRLIEPEEVAEMAAYLCSPAAAAVTGASMVMDGGWTAH